MTVNSKYWILISVMSILVSAVNAADLRNEIVTNPALIRPLLKQGKLYAVDVPNPHWKQDMCLSCHEAGGQMGRTNLRTTNIEIMCGYCHNEFSKEIFMHPTGVSLNDNMWNNIPSGFRQSLASLGGRASRLMNCLSCHDLKLQCLNRGSTVRMSNPLFLRGGPYNSRVEQCFFCHESSMFQRFNPHKQISNGKIIKASCKSCHLDVENLTPETKFADVKLAAKRDLSQLCVNCHPYKPHPGGETGITKKKEADHLVVPKAETRRFMDQMRTTIDVEFPVTPGTGKMHCATCHNPHEKGVVAYKAADTGADIKHRLRMKKTCNFCHEY
ncbi:MAG: hypothetical protein OEZ68_04515 [Gammaproteobacteria bacterium]|nr:hypothetical protein [Gammaproteobacteria bacterium]MDH5800052.1 hypothetical protein [Gammaproteobacteria bacterium]